MRYCIVTAKMIPSPLESKHFDRVAFHIKVYPFPLKGALYKVFFCVFFFFFFFFFVFVCLYKSHKTL